MMDISKSDLTCTAATAQDVTLCKYSKYYE